MQSTRIINRTGGAIAALFTLAIGCNSIIGLDKISVDAAEPADSAGASGAHMGGTGNSQGGVTSQAGSVSVAGGGSTSVATGGESGAPDTQGDCTTNQECTDRASAGVVGAAGAGPETVAAVCVKQGVSHCVPLLSEDCNLITGDYLNDQAIILGSLFSTKGATAATNLPRQQSAELAIEQINAAGGVPSGSTSANPRPLVLVSCDESTNLVRAADHLVNDLHVPAIVGPNTSQDTLDVSTKVTVPGGTVVMSPTGVASSIAALTDNDLTWLMVPSDVQRAPLMISQINDLEQSLKLSSGKLVIKLGVVFRNDALGIGTRTSLNDLVLNGKPLADVLNLGQNVQIDPYNGTDANEQPIISKYVTFAPDIIVLAGTAEAITKVMVPLEAAWTAPDRPNYVLIDSTKVPELLTAVTNNDDLRMRIRGTGITPGPAGNDTPGETFNGFQVDFGVRFGASATISGMGPSHDAAYAIGLALAATTDQPVSGKSVAAGLRKLAGGSTVLEATGTNVLAAFQKLAAGQQITEIGTFGMLDWDANGAVKGGTLEMWCVGGPSTKPAYGS
ncbi:MAG TPA: ABC transporter substrate-binding protein, partial [Polyangiaceae bacterium]|nr:ABC transporter substrate-binding protein [Polyangiaceae bacterium]